jgi:uncharacterized protein
MMPASRAEDPASLKSLPEKPLALRICARISTICIYIVRYEWGEEKNRSNQRKHDGISFELATLVFEDDRCLLGSDRIDETGEQRWHAIGMAQIEPEGAVVLLVVHAYRENCRGEEIIRIISARRAEKHDVRRYQEQAMD